MWDTRDINLAAFLGVKGFVLERVEWRFIHSRDVAFFVFTTEPSGQLLSDWLNRRSQVEPQMFTVQLRELKAKVHGRLQT